MAWKGNEIYLENHGLEYDRKLKQKQLDIATKGLREMIIKQNTRDFRREQQDKAARRSKEYGKVLFEVSLSFSWDHKVDKTQYFCFDNLINNDKSATKRLIKKLNEDCML